MLQFYPEKNWKMIHLLRFLFLVFVLPFIPLNSIAQINNNGCVGANFGVDAGLYSGIIEYGTGTPAAGSKDWFVGPSTGIGTIDESQTATLTTLLSAGGNPLYEVRMNSALSSIVNNQILIDGLFARDYFGGTGFIDISTFETASKNGEDPAIWDAGQANVLGKNDIIDVAGHMMRDGTNLAFGVPSDLWFFGIINRAEPGGSAYMDFEFFVEDVAFNAAPTPADAGEGNFSSGGPQLGHTAFTFKSNGNGTDSIASVGDFIFNVSLVNGGVDADVELRLWVSYADYTTTNPVTFSWGPDYDGGFNGSPYGYASVIPNALNSGDACGKVNLSGQTPAAPPWGTLNTKYNTYGTSYAEYSIVEVGINMTAFGLDHSSLSGTDPCLFPINTFMAKTRASASFTAQLKDYAGPYEWGTPSNASIIVGDPLISCENPTVTLTATPFRPDMTYTWVTVNGNIVSDPNLANITVDLPGTYTLQSLLPTGCPIPDQDIVVGFDATKPFFNATQHSSTVSCSGSDGTIDITPSGATPPYSYLWSNGATTEDIQGLAPGTYTVVITDQIPCETYDTVVVAARVPTIISEVVTDVDCHGNSTGAIDISVSGQSPFSYVWSTGSSLEDIAGLSVGSYSVTTTDADNCTEVKNILVNEPSALSLSISKTDETDPALNDGTIDLSVTGGTAPYTYDWDYNGAENPDTDPQDLSGLAYGSYTVTVTDANGCISTISTFIYEPEICNDGIDNDGDGLTDCFDTECIPPPPGPITPSLDPVCVGDVGITYSIAAVTGATSYVWTVPAGAVITGGQGTTTITVNWVSNIGGQVCVSSDNVGCVQTPPTCFTVTLEDVPPVPTNINVNNN